MQQVHAVAEQMREHHIMQSVQLPDMVSSCKQLYDVAMGNQAELGPDMTRLKVLRCACGSPMPVLMPRAPLTHYLLIHDPVGCTGRGEARGSRELCACAGYQMLMLMLMFIHDPAHGDRGCAFYRVLNF